MMPVPKYRKCTKLHAEDEMPKARETIAFADFFYYYFPIRYLRERLKQEAEAAVQRKAFYRREWT